MTTALVSTFGLDVWSREDADPTLVAIDLDLVGQDLFWRLQTPRGSGILATDAPEYGMDLLDAIGSANTAADAAALPGRIRSEATKDERINDCVVTVVSSTLGPVTTWTITIVATTDAGPFTLVLSANDVTVELISLSTGAAS
jgi:hypothetical protein